MTAFVAIAGPLLPTRARAYASARGRALPRTPLAALSALLLAGAALAAPPPGTAIPNTATATHAGADTSRSNTVVAIVERLDALRLEPPRMVLASPGGNATLRHRLDNLSNAAADVRIEYGNTGGDDYDLATLSMCQDLNADGACGAGDAPIPSGTVVTLPPGAGMDLVLRAGVPVAAAPSTHGHVAVTATALAGGAVASLEDRVVVHDHSVAPGLGFYDPAYSGTVRFSTPGRPLYLQALAHACSHNLFAADTIPITLRSRLTGDVETVPAHETGVHTELYRIGSSMPTGLGPAVPGDGTLSTRRGDEIIAELSGCHAPIAFARLWMDPAGVVFDARTGAPVGGAHVTLLDVTGAGNGGNPGGAATVLQEDGVSPAPSSVVSDAQGRFQFPFVAPSTYRLEVVAPAPYGFPALVPPGSLPAGFVVDPVGSFGQPFVIATPESPVILDLPVDAGQGSTLFAEKSASRPSVELGEALEYAVRIANRSDSAFAAVTLRDELPPGFRYLSGSARRDGAPLPDPSGGAGPALEFALGPLAPDEAIEVRYGVAVGAGASYGDAVNRAVARAGAFESNQASARVRVEEGLFAQGGTIVGAVRLETRVHAGSPALPAAATPEAPAPDAVLPPRGVAGVRVWLDDGTFAITDAHGRFSFTHVTPRTHALKVDPATLPPGSRLVATDHRESGQPGLRFVDLVRGDLQRAEFTLHGDSVTARDVGRRMIAASGRQDDLARALARGTAPLVSAPVAGDPRALPARGVIAGEAETAVAAAAAAAPAPRASLAYGASPLPLEQIARTLDPELGFVGHADLDTVSVPQAAVRVKGPIGTVLALRVNGERISESRVGLRVTVPETGVEAWEYVGVALRPGLNRIEVAPPRSLGRAALRLVAPGPLARLAIEAPARAPADGRSLVPVRIRTLDQAGVPYGARTLVTLHTGAGAFQVTDLNPDEAGVQVAVEYGEAVVPLVAPASFGDSRVSATAGTLSAATRVRFVPDMSPLLAVGALEGVVGFGRSGTFGSPVEREVSSFEAGIDQFASTRRDGRAMAAAHGAMFARGRLRDDLALTVGYDSDRPRDQRQQRDMATESGPPLLGDGATRGYDAQSTGRLYARLDRGESSLLYGDFVTRDAGHPRSLSTYARSLTGAQSHWEHRGVTVNAFASRDRSAQRIEELRGLGLSGPYTLAGAPLVEHSERVEIVVRDRNQPALVLSRTARQRFTDYEIESLTGRLTFRSPVPAIDAALNPVSIRVTYESETGGEPFWVSGVESHVKLGERVELGGTYVDDHETGAERELRAFSVAARLGDHSRFESEVAATRRLGEPSGLGSRFELAHENGATQARAWLAATGSRFDNPGAGFAQGRTEGGARFAARLTERTRLTGEALWSADALGRDRRAGVLAALDRPLGRSLRGEFGVRVAGERRRDGDVEPGSAALRSRLTLQIPSRPEWSGYAEIEQDVREFDRRMLAVGGEHRFSARGRLYARHELMSSLEGPFAFSAAERQLSTVAGVDADLTRDTRVFSEYRLGDSFAGREAQAAVGLRNGWRLPGGLRLGTGFERVSALEGGTAGPSTAVSASVENTEEKHWRGSSRFEVRSSRASDSYLQTLAAAVRIDSAWTGLFRHHLDLTNAHGAPGSARLRFQVGAAWRPGRNWDALGRLEFRYDREGAGPDGVTRAAANAFAAPGSRRRIARILALQAAGKLDQHFHTSLAWAGKLARDEGIAGATHGGAQWARGRATLDLAHGWDVGLQTSVLIGSRLGDRRYGTGAELGRQMSPGVWLSAGYNHFGYRDDELTGADWTRAGAYLRLRAKFDERLFGLGAEPPVAPLEPAAAPARPASPAPRDYTGGDAR